MKELVEIMAKALVDNPDQLEVSKIAGSDTLVLARPYLPLLILCF